MPPTIAHYNGTLIWHPENGTTSTPPKLVVTLPNHSTLQSHPAMAPLALPQTSPPTIAHYNGNTIAPSNGTQQWHHVHLPKVGRHPPLWHPAMAPSNGTTSTTTLQWILQWHAAMAPSNGTTSTTPKLVVTLFSGTLQWHPAMAPRPLPQSWSSPSPRHLAAAPCNGTSNGTQQRHHVHSPKVGHHPPPQP